MSETDDRERRRGSLLALAHARAGERQEAGAHPLPESGRAEHGVSAAERHTVARSRREAAPNPLIAALARSEQARLSALAGKRGRSAAAHDEAQGLHPARRKDNRPAEDAAPGRVQVAEEPFERESAELRDIFAVPRAAHREERAAGREEQPEASFLPIIATQPAHSAERGAGDDEYWRPMIDPAAVVSGIVRSRWIILATTVAGALIGAAVALSTPKVYEAGAELLVDPRELKFTDSELTSGGLSADATLAIVENQVRVIMSSSVMNKVVDRLGLERDPEFNGQQGGGIGSVISGLRSLISLGGGGAGGGVDRRRALAVENLYSAVDAERGGRTFVISIHATSQSADKSALIANTVADVFLETYGELAAGTAGRASVELTARLEELRNAVEAAERKVEAFKAENDIVDAQGRLITDDEILKLNDQLSTARARTLELDARAASARSVTVDTILTGNLPEQMSSPVLSEMRAQYATLRQQADRLAVKLGPRHPERVAVEAEVGASRRQIEQELRLVASSIQVDLKRAVQLEQGLAARLAQLKARQANLSEEMVTLRELERDAASKRAVYEAFLLRARETGEQKDINAVNISVISRAAPPLDPTGMSRTTRTMLSAVMGFGAGVAVGAARGAVAGFRGNGGTPGAPSPEPARTPAPSAPSERLAAFLRSRRETGPAEAAPARDDGRDADATPTETMTTAAAAAQPAEEAQMNRMPYPPAWPAEPPREHYPAGPAPQSWQDPYSDPRFRQPSAVHPAGWPDHPGPVPPQRDYYGHPGVQQPMPYPHGQAASPYSSYLPAQQGGWQQPGMWPAPHQGQPPQTHWQGQPAHQPQPWSPQGWHGQQPNGYPAHVQPANPPQAVQPPAAASSEAEKNAIDEIRDSLREFRQTLRELAEGKGRRRFI